LNNLLNIINYLSIGSSLMLAFLLIINPQKVNKKANLWFGAFILGICILIFGDVLIALKMSPESPELRFFLNFPGYLIAPIFYLSVDYYINPTKKWDNKNFLLFFFAIFMIVFMIATHISFIQEILSNNEKSFKIFFLFLNVLFALQLIPFFYLAHRKIIKHQKNVRLFSSTLESVDLKWLEHMIKGTVVMGGFWIANIMLQFSSTNATFNLISNLIYLLGFFFILYHSMKQKEIYPFNEEEKEEIHEIITETDIPAENRKKLLPDEKLEEAKSDLEQLMEKDKPFFDCELSLVKLAHQMNTSTHILSYVINNGFDENFYQFVNRYRIEEAKKLILNPKMSHFNLIGIAYEVGFNSKTVFNTTFKKYTELTPTEFKKTMVTN
jgi:AraC-like DNA-binding protein/flagellar biogenesis protein FliO